MSPQPLRECRLLIFSGLCGQPSLSLQDPAHSSLVFIGYSRKHLLSTLPCAISSWPQTFPLEAVVLGVTDFTFCPCPSRRSPHPSGFGTFAMWKSTICHPPVWSSTVYSLPVWVTAIIMTLLCGIIHMIIEQYSCCVLCLSSGGL